MAHRVFVAFLIIVGIMALVSVGAHGLMYYLTPLTDRAFRADYVDMKPSGTFSHGLGVVGATMIVIGVATYSSRKRVRSLWTAGKLSTWLEFHIFLCLLGPVLVVYHTTFKAGGIAAISMWTMLSVVASGFIGRFLYILIPRNLKGNELSSNQINEEFDRLGATLNESDMGMNILKMIDNHFVSITRPKTLGETIRTFFHLSYINREVKRAAKKLLAGSHLPHHVTRKIYKAASARSSLIRRSIVLLQVEKLFYYWHAIHLPFTVMMFVTLVAHVGVAIWLGYHWVF